MIAPPNDTTEKKSPDNTVEQEIKIEARAKEMAYCKYSAQTIDNELVEAGKSLRRSSIKRNLFSAITVASACVSAAGFGQAIHQTVVAWNAPSMKAEAEVYDGLVKRIRTGPYTPDVIPSTRAELERLQTSINKKLANGHYPQESIHNNNHRFATLYRRIDTAQVDDEVHARRIKNIRSIGEFMATLPITAAQERYAEGEPWSPNKAEDEKGTRRTNGLGLGVLGLFFSLQGYGILEERRRDVDSTKGYIKDCVKERKQYRTRILELETGAEASVDFIDRARVRKCGSTLWDLDMPNSWDM